MSTTLLFNAALTDTFAPSQPIMIAGNSLVLDFEVVVETLMSLEWYAEFEEDGDPNDPDTVWYREVAEVTSASGNVALPKAVRAFQENGGAGLAAGTHRLSVPLVRSQRFARLQLRAASGTGRVKVTTPDGIVPQSAQS